MTKIIKWAHSNGETKEYVGFEALAEALGVAYQTAYRYVAMGWTCDSDINKKSENPRPAIVGNKYASRSSEDMRSYWREAQEKSRNKRYPNRKRRTGKEG